MIKRFLSVFVLCGILSSGMVLAADYGENKGVADNQVFTGRSEYQNLRTCLDFVADVMAASNVKYNEARVSPIIMSEEWYEFPLEFGWLSPQKDLAPVCEKLFSYSFGGSKLAQSALNISCSADSTEDGEPFLFITSQKKLICLAGADKRNKENDSQLWSSVFKQNQLTVKAIRSLLLATTFKPQVSKRIEKNTGEKPGNKKTWLTNLRIDGDNRIQITGYGLDAKEVTKLGEELFKTGHFTEVFLTSMNKNVYEKVPVWRFDMVAKIN